jgi:hypothetical protein
MTCRQSRFSLDEQIDVWIVASVEVGMWPYVADHRNIRPGTMVEYL